MSPLPDYPNALDLPISQGKTFTPRFRFLAALVLICLVLRGLMAMRVPSVCPDGALYIQLAKALDGGDIQRGSEGIGLNIYPIILMLLHRAGLDWETAGVVWGVLIGSLVVLPLYGWVRRQFDDRVAAMACVLYATHPRAIEWSPEIVRDPTFWFLLTLSLYLLWRAVTEIRLRWFLLAGPTLILATSTRFEGWALLFPLLFWALWRWLALPTVRSRLALGVILCVAAVPVLALVGGICWPRVFWEHLPLRLDMWTRFQTWLECSMGNVSAPQVGLNPTLPPHMEPMPLTRMLRVFVATMTRGLSPLYALLMFGGLWAWRRTWARRDHQAIFYAALAVLVGIWIQLWYDLSICTRYALSIVLAASPFAALGLLGLAQRAGRMAERLGATGHTRDAAAGLLIFLVAAVGMGSAMTSNRPYFASRKFAADLGRWMRHTPVSAPMIVGPVALTPIVQFYAGKGRYETFRTDTADASTIVRLVEQCNPDFLLLRTTKRIDIEQSKRLAEQMKCRGFREIEPVGYPKGSDPVVVLVGRRMSLAMALSNP